MLSTRLLNQFIAVAEELHFGRAAARVNIAQSPLSQAIKRLEHILGVELFTRTKRSVALTPAGEAFLSQARLILHNEQMAVRSARVAQKPGAGRLSVGFVGTVAYGVVPRLLHAFREQHSDIELQIKEITTRDQMRELQGGQLDAGILRLPLPFRRPPGLCFRTVENDKFGIVLPIDHPSAARRRIALADMAQEPFVMYSHDRVALLHSQSVSACLDEGFYPHVVCEAWQASSILSFVAAGVGVAIVPSHLSALQHPGVVFRPLARSEKGIDLEIAVVWRQDDDGDALKAFLSFLPEGARKRHPKGETAGRTRRAAARP